MKSAEEGAQTTLYCALAPRSDLVGGAYYVDCVPAATTAHAARVDEARTLWTCSERLAAHWLRA